MTGNSLGLYSLCVAVTVCRKGGETNKQRLNMEFDLQCLFGLHVDSCTYSLAETPRPPPPPTFGLIYEGAIGQTTSLCDSFKQDNGKNCGTRLIHLSLPEASNLRPAFGRLIDLYEPPCRKTSLGQGD